MIDFSHANSEKNHTKQMTVCDNVCAQLAAGEHRIFGVMVESNLVEGNQKVVAGTPLTYGQSITDACINWADTQQLCRNLANAVRSKRNKK